MGLPQLKNIFWENTKLRCPVAVLALYHNLGTTLIIIIAAASMDIPVLARFGTHTSLSIAAHPINGTTASSYSQVGICPSIRHDRFDSS